LSTKGLQGLPFTKGLQGLPFTKGIRACRPPTHRIKVDGKGAKGILPKRTHICKCLALHGLGHHNCPGGYNDRIFSR